MQPNCVPEKGQRRAMAFSLPQRIGDKNVPLVLFTFLRKCACCKSFLSDSNCMFGLAYGLHCASFHFVGSADHREGNIKSGHENV